MTTIKDILNDLAHDIADNLDIDIEDELRFQDEVDFPADMRKLSAEEIKENKINEKVDEYIEIIRERIVG